MLESTIQATLQKPVFTRCKEITNIIDQPNVKIQDLHTLYPILIESIFGFNNTTGWELHHISLNTNTTDFNVLQQFFSCGGPLMRMIDKLQAEPSLIYNFPLYCLPASTRQLIEDGTPPAQYLSRLVINQYTHTATHVALTPFEFYFYHFAYMLVNAKYKNQSLWLSPAEALYPNIFEGYLNNFFPTKPNQMPPVASYSSPMRSQTPYKSPQIGHSMLSQHKSPFGGLLKSQSPLLSRSLSLQNASYEAPEPETWRSQTLLQIFIDFWLNHNSASVERQGIGQRIMENMLPSSDHMRVARMLVKHMHYFVNSQATVSSHQAISHVGQFEEFKRSIPGVIQRPVYTFLRNAFDRWPLDSSFRLVLETWLSYIQPWRYLSGSSPPTSPTVPENANKNRDKDKPLDLSWFPFIAENCLFYTKIFEEFIQRMSRVDLGSPKNAYMLFRVAKVLGQANLKDIVEKVEQGLIEPSESRLAGSPELGNSYLSHGSGNLNALFNLQIAELEGPMFCYTPIFCGQVVRKKVEQLLRCVMEAKASVEEGVVSVVDKTSNSFMSWLGFGPLLDYNATRYKSTDEHNFDGKKTKVHLQQVIIYLCRIFNIREESVHLMGMNKSVSFNRKVVRATPDHIDTPGGPVLTPLGRYQLINGLRKFEISFQCDPELQPIRSYENASLVRFFYTLSHYFNQKFSEEINQVYHRNDFLGRVTRQWLLPPKGNSPNTLNTLEENNDTLRYQPRLSLRFLANYQNLGYIIALYFLLFVWFGTGPISYVFLLLILVLVYGIMAALIVPRDKNLYKKNT